MKNPRLLFSLVLFLISINAIAQEPGWYNIKSAVGDKYMSVLENRNDNGAQIVIDSYDGTAKQLFEVVRTSDGYFNIKTAKGKCLAIENASTAAKAKIVIWDFHNQNNTKWKLDINIIQNPAFPGYFSMTSELGTRIDVPGAKYQRNVGLWTWSPNNSNAQLWRLEKTGSPTAYAANSNLACDIKPIRLNSISSRCLTMKDNKNGSHHFDSRVSAKGYVSLSILNGVQIQAEVSLNLKGTKSGAAELEKKWSQILYTAPDGKFIEALGTAQEDDFVQSLFGSFSQSLGESGSELPFGCNDGEKHTILVSEVNGYVTVIGDTGAEDISDDNNCKCDSRLESLTFDNIYIKIRGINVPRCDVNSKNICTTLKSRHKFNYVLFDPSSGAKLQKESTRKIDSGCEVIPSAKFVLVRSGNNLFKIKSFESGRFLEINGDQAVFTNNSLSNEQLWQFEIVGTLENMGYSYRIKNTASGKYLHTEYGKLGLVENPGGWWSAIWSMGDCECRVGPL